MRVASIRALPLDSLPYCYPIEPLSSGNRGLSPIVLIRRFL